MEGRVLICQSYIKYIISYIPEFNPSGNGAISVLYYASKSQAKILGSVHNAVKIKRKISSQVKSEIGSFIPVA